MPTVPQLDRVIEIRFHRQAGVSSRTAWARLEADALDYQARQTVTRLHRRTYRIRYAPDMLDELRLADKPGPVRVFDEGLEYVVNRASEQGRRQFLVLECVGFTG